MRFSRKVTVGVRKLVHLHLSELHDVTGIVSACFTSLVSSEQTAPWVQSFATSTLGPGVWLVWLVGLENCRVFWVRLLAGGGFILTFCKIMSDSQALSVTLYALYLKTVLLMGLT